jgi:hypothetical protein
MNLDNPWLRLQQFVAADAQVACASTPRALPPALLPRLALAARLCSAYHMSDYAAFFRLYARVCNTTDSDHFDPIAMALLQPSVAPAGRAR